MANPTHGARPRSKCASTSPAYCDSGCERSAWRLLLTKVRIADEDLPKLWPLKICNLKSKIRNVQLFFFQQHLRQRCSRRHHRKHIGFRCAIKHQQLGLRRMQETINLISRFLRNREFAHVIFFHAETVNLVCLSDLYKIRVVAQVGFGVVALVEQLLPLPHHPEIFIVDDNHLHWQPETMHRSQFLNVHLKSTISGNAEHARIRLGELHTNGRRQSEAHRSESARGNKTPW